MIQREVVSEMRRSVADCRVLQKLKHKGSRKMELREREDREGKRARCRKGHMETEGNGIKEEKNTLTDKKSLYSPHQTLWTHLHSLKSSRSAAQ